MKLRILTVLLAFILVIGMVPGAMATETENTAAAEETKPVRGEYECGDDLVWAYADGILTITGTGEMDDYEDEAPWAEYADEIDTVILSEEVTYIGARAFKNYDKLESVYFGEKLKEIGTEAFYSCEGLTSVELPATFKIFGESAFLGCANLKEIHCSGNFPSFRLNCLWDCYATIYYPVQKPWSEALIDQLEEAFKGRIKFLASDGTDPYAPETETTLPAETEATTEVPTEPVTEAPTEVTTEPATEATEAPTEDTAPAVTAAPETEAPTQMPQDTEEPVDEGDEKNNLLLTVIGVGVVVILVLVIALILALRQLKKGGKYSK